MAGMFNGVRGGTDGWNAQAMQVAGAFIVPALSIRTAIDWLCLKPYKYNPYNTDTKTHGCTYVNLK
jgi:hypothetical protein